MTDHEKALLEAYERGYAKGVEDERQRTIGRDPDMFRVPVYGPVNWPPYTVTCNLIENPLVDAVACGGRT